MNDNDLKATENQILNTLYEVGKGYLPDDLKIHSYWYDMFCIHTVIELGKEIKITFATILK